MLHVKLKSAHIAAAAYDQDSGRLVVYFHREQPREFEAVPEKTFDKFTRAGSPGTFYIKNIRQKFSRIEN